MELTPEIDLDTDLSIDELEAEDLMNKLLTLLNLEKIEEGLFRGQSEDLGLRQVFGGQVVGQALYAAKE
ncbi:DUF1493 family protein, partial [Salmonella enterica subsp. enterica serovar Kentucky]|nr:DUF1493 family protein [Salmonella enterica subsp. enterica serovar Kentucky]